LYIWVLSAERSSPTLAHRYDSYILGDVLLLNRWSVLQEKPAPQMVEVMRNHAALIVRGNDDDHHHHQQNNYQHSHDNTPKTIITAAQIVPQAPTPPMGYVSMPQPMMPYAQAYPQQAYPGQAPPPPAATG
jgi:hypothetical protein